MREWGEKKISMYKKKSMMNRHTHVLNPFSLQSYMKIPKDMNLFFNLLDK
jgi:hypothetical protein